MKKQSFLTPVGIALLFFVALAIGFCGQKKNVNPPAPVKGVVTGGSFETVNDTILRYVVEVTPFGSKEALKAKINPQAISAELALAKSSAMGETIAVLPHPLFITLDAGPHSDSYHTILEFAGRPYPPSSILIPGNKPREDDAQRPRPDYDN